MIFPGNWKWAIQNDLTAYAKDLERVKQLTTNFANELREVHPARKPKEPRLLDIER